MGRGTWVALTLLAVLVFVPAAGHASAAPSGPTCQAGDTTVTIANFSFTPSDVTIPSGGTVCWTNSAGSFNHTATSDDATTFDSGQLVAGASYRFTFTSDGDYPYHCTNHPLSMLGTIHVGAPPPPPPPP